MKETSSEGGKERRERAKEKMLGDGEKMKKDGNEMMEGKCTFFEKKYKNEESFFFFFFPSSLCAIDIVVDTHILIVTMLNFSSDDLAVHKIIKFVCLLLRRLIRILNYFSLSLFQHIP